MLVDGESDSPSDESDVLPGAGAASRVVLLPGRGELLRSTNFQHGHGAHASLLVLLLPHGKDAPKNSPASLSEIPRQTLL
jgi:hypothetical protein